MRFLLGSALLFFASLLSGQGLWQVGPTGGFQFTSAYIEHSVYSVNMINKAIPGFHGGVVVENLAEYRDFKTLNTGVRFGVQYYQRGWKQDYLTLDSLISSVNTEMNYLNIPFEGLLYGGNPDNMVYASLGMYLDFLLDYRTSDEPQDINPINDFWTYDPERDRSFGYGLKGGMGWKLKVGPGLIGLEAFFGYSISNFIYTNNRAEDIPDISNHWAVGGNVSYVIRLVKDEGG